MDLPAPPPSYFEYNIEIPSSEPVKRKAFDAMNQLEGWCTQQKASILIDLVMWKKPEKIVEIGVFGGKSLIPMAFALKECGNKGKIYGIDPWDSKASAEGMDGVNYEWWSKLDHESIFLGLIAKTALFDLFDHVEYIRSRSENAPLFSDIDILHVDGNHGEAASYLDVTKYGPRVKKGGLIIFDDINWATAEKAVDWLNKNCIPFAKFHDMCIWGIWVKP